MVNQFDSNFARKLIEIFLEKFDTARVLSKNVDTQLLQGRFNPSSGTVVSFKRPTDYKSVRTVGGDVSGPLGKSDIITGRADGIVQNFFTVHVDYANVDEALKMNQLEELLAPMATRIATDLEIDFANFMMINSGLLQGTVGTPVTLWKHVADAGALLSSTGVAMDNPWFYTMNPFTQSTLADVQRSLGAGGVAGTLVKTAHEDAIVSRNFAGMTVMTGTALSTFTPDTEADRVGALASNPDVTYVTAKDTMTQVLDIDSIGVGTPTIFAGETVTITAAAGAINRLNLSTRKEVVDATGAAILWTGTVTTDVALVAGAGLITVTGPAIFESGGQYNTVSQAPLSGDVITFGGAASVLQQPNLFWSKQAFGIGSVKLPKLHAQDMRGTTEDGLSIRVSMGSNILENKQIVRFDFLPAYAVFNPFMAGQGFGST